MYLDLDTNQIDIKKRIGIVPQELNIDPFFTPYELLELQAGLYGVKKQNRKTNEILDNMQLLDKKNSYARSLSGGMRRRLLIAKALVHDPGIIFLDEPTAGVDVELYDMWGAGNSRSGSGGASRIIRLAYGDDKIYTELTNNSFNFWEELSNESERKLYDECGMLWLVSQDDNS